MEAPSNGERESHGARRANAGHAADRGGSDARAEAENYIEEAATRVANEILHWVEKAEAKGSNTDLEAFLRAVGERLRTR